MVLTSMVNTRQHRNRNRNLRFIAGGADFHGANRVNTRVKTVSTRHRADDHPQRRKDVEHLRHTWFLASWRLPACAALIREKNQALPDRTLSLRCEELDDEGATPATVMEPEGVLAMSSSLAWDCRLLRPIDRAEHRREPDYGVTNLLGFTRLAPLPFHDHLPAAGAANGQTFSPLDRSKRV